MSYSRYTAEAVAGPEGIADVRLLVNGKTWHLWGRFAETREKDLADKVPEDALPVLMGSGLGHALKALIEDGRSVAVVDRESEITRITGLKRIYATNPNVLWVDSDTPQKALDQLTRWQAENDSLPFAPVILPIYLRLDRDYYGVLADTLKASAQTDFWSQAQYPKFQHSTPRVLFIDSNYFLCGEILASMKRLSMEFRTIQLDQSGIGSQSFVESLLKSVIDFKPDFILTVNHFGLDRKGKLAGLLEELHLPLASWFVDNPHLILHEYAHPGTDNTAIFTYDAGNLAQMRNKGFPNVHYLPLATDPNRFKPGLANSSPPEWRADVSFVGNSMTDPVANCLRNAALPGHLQNEYETVATAFGKSGESSVEEYLKLNQPKWHAALTALPTTENRLALESLLTWEATRQYRLHCVRQTLDFAPLIVGDDGWKTLLDSRPGWRHLSGIDYYQDLPHFYPCSTVNFNCTSRQMVGAVNQRVFDVPACGGFLVTDYREQMEDLFDLGTEVAIYRSPADIPELIERHLKDRTARERISKAARVRILAEHTYEIRMKRLVSIMRSTFG